jgi:hypothetical protein
MHGNAVSVWGVSVTLSALSEVLIEPCRLAVGAPADAAEAAAGPAVSAWNAWVVGAVIAVLAIWAIAAFAEGLDWLNGILGVWLVIAPVGARLQQPPRGGLEPRGRRSPGAGFRGLGSLGRSPESDGVAGWKAGRGG